MSIVRVEEEIQPLKYLVITQERDPESVITTNIILSDNRLNKINLINVERGPQGSVGPVGPQGPPGINGVDFDVLPISSGGTNNTFFNSGNIIYYDGQKLSSSDYTFDDIINLSNPNTITGILAGSGLYKVSNDNTAELGVIVGDGLSINGSNEIVIDNTIARKIELNLGSIDGTVPISKGGTNNQAFVSNRLLYYDGSQISSFPLSTGRILVSGMTIDIVAGSGLIGGGKVTLPSGSIVLNIGQSSDILVDNNSISLSTTGTPGTYTKIITDSKGRVISGTNLTQSDILNILGYTPWNPNNDGENSGLDADLLDGLDSSYFRDLANSTGVISADSLPIQTSGGTFTKVQVNDKGIVINGLNNNYFDIINALGYIPFNTSGDTVNGSLTVTGDTTLNGDSLTIKDNLPTIGTNSSYILPSEPRGFSFLYGGYTEKTGILAYYPAEQQLRLVTNITSLSGTVDGGNGSGNQFMDDVDGGDQNAVYLVNNLTGTANIVLFKNIADSLYVSRINNQAISGLKIFVDGLTINKQLSIVSDVGQTTPPISVGSNSNMVENLNVDLLHGHNDEYYRNAINMTGLFSYENVEFDNLEGTAGYIARFDTRTSNPSRTVSSSIIREKTDSSAIIIENQANLFVGSSNSGSFLSNNSILAGTNNKAYQDNSLAIGTNNTISGNNSVALNTSSTTFKNNSIAAGNNGYTWSENQLSFGAFADTSGSVSLAQGQYSTISLGLNGVVTNGNWYSMSPSVVIPKNKTIAYNLEIILNKVAGTGAAVIAYQSGIIKNSTYRDPNNITTIRNISTNLRSPDKNIVYNDSQYRNHYFNYKFNDNNITQNLSVTRPPLKNNPIEPQNVDSVYKYVPSYTSLSGTFVKTNDGTTKLSFDQPVTTGWFYKASGTHEIRIKSYNHNMTSGCMVDINFMSGSIYRPHSKYYEVNRILDKDNFIINELEWNGLLTNNNIYIDTNSYISTDLENQPAITGTIITNSNTIYNTINNPIGVLSTGMTVIFGPIPGIYPDIPQLLSSGKIVSLSNNSITIDSPYTGLYNSATINCSGFCRVKSYAEYHLENTKTLQLNIPGSGYGPVTKISGISYVSDYPFCQSGLSILVSGINAPYTGQIMSFSPAITNSGTVNLIHRRNYNGAYTQNNASFKKYDCFYTQYESVDGQSITRLYNQELKDIFLPSAPFEYSLVCSYGGYDNSKFYISGNKLYANTDINFDPTEEYTIRIASTDRSNRTYDRILSISSGENNESINYSINSTSFDITNILVDYSIQSGITSGSVIATLYTQGGYAPYVIFNTASNSITGVLTSGSNIISNCINVLYTGYPTSSISGSFNSLYSGMTLYSNIPNITFSGTIVDTSGNNLIIDTVYSGNTVTGLITYNGTKPTSQQYYPNKLFVFNSSVLTQPCSVYENYLYTKGFEFDTDIVSTGYYLTGIASVYTSQGVSKLTIGSLNGNMHLYPNTDNNIHIKYNTGAITGFIREKTYHTISGIMPASFETEQLYLYPDSGVYQTGLCSIDLNRNHGFEVLNNKLINQVPVNFVSVSQTNNNRLPKNNLFDIISVSGNEVTINDSKNYLLKENNRPDYFEQRINGLYSTNGFRFSGVFISGSNNIYDCFYITNIDDKISQLNKNTTLGSNYYAWEDHNILAVQEAVTFSGWTQEGSNYITLSNFNPPIALVSGMTLYSSAANIPLNDVSHIRITQYISESGMISVSQPLYGVNSGIPSGAIFDISIKPCISLNKPVCLSNQYYGTGLLFFNGNKINISNLSTPRSYLNNNDQIKILQINNSNYNSQSYDVSQYVKISSTAFNNTSISGESTNIFAFGLSRNTYLNNTGSLSFIGCVSGYYDVPINNIYYHSYGGSTSNWPRDSNGKDVTSPITGYYTIGTSTTSCSSGTLCLSIEGFSDTNFNNLIDIIDRRSIGKNDPIIDQIDTSGYIRPWGILNRRFYFDFSDDCPEINGIYYINDKINPKTISINIPYNVNYLGRSGLVYIIDSEENIKSNLNPNLDNAFIVNNSDISIPQNSNLYNYSINSFNDNTKRWKHLVHFNNTAINYSGYDITIKQNTPSKILAISPDIISIHSIQYSIDDGSTYNTLERNGTLTIPSTQSSIYLRVSTINGSNKWSNALQASAPKINIYGLSSYSIDTENITYNYVSKTWNIDIIVSDINLNYTDHKFTVYASDDSGRDNFDAYIDTNIIPNIEESNTAYTYQNGSNWILSYKIKDLTDNHLILMSGYPGSGYTISDEQLYNSSGIKIVTGPPGAIAGTFSPTLIVRDLLTDELLATRSSTIVVLPLNQQIPTYTVAPMGLDDDIFLNFTDYNSNVRSFDFYLPAVDSQETELSITFEPDPNYSITPVIEYSNYSQRYRVTALVSGEIGYYPYKNVNISINQPTLNDNDELVWNNYLYNKSINLTLYKDLQISKNVSFEPIISDIEQPWAMHFTVTNGVISHRPDVPPRVTLSNLPNIGTYENQPLEYTITSVYDSGYKRWNVSAVGKADFFQKYADSLGYNSVKIYAEDGHSLSEDSISLLFNQTAYMSNIKPYIYATPNNNYFSNIDIKNTNFNAGIPPAIDIPGDIKENTISLNLKNAKYDNNLNLWEYGYSGSPIYDKWDANIEISNIDTFLGGQDYSVIDIQCKGIATDKLYGIGKLDLIELDTNFIPGIPLTITEIRTPNYPAVEGSSWSIQFSTIGGLENPNYPPTILLSGLPTPCSGYNARIPLQQQNSCFVSRLWNNSLKRWDFTFEGLPLCRIEGLKNFSIIAIDTDSTFYYGSDQKNAAILYQSLLDAGADHPTPTIIPQSNNTPATVPLYPFCNNTSVDLYYKFGPRVRETCPVPTGITGWLVSGSLPPGLSYSISFPGGNPKIPWNNIGSGTFRITGIPTAFANGGLYNEKLYLTVRDARNKFFTKEFKFTDASTANPPSPINLTVYFDSTDNVYTGRSIVPGSPLGTLRVDRNLAGNIYTYWPPADKDSLDCLSILPHNQCSISNFVYDGGNYNEGNINVIISGTKMPLNPNDTIYVEFDNNSNNEFNGAYNVLASGSYRYIEVPSQYFDTGVGRLVVQQVSQFNTSNLQKFNGTLSTPSTKSILGCGYIKYEDDVYGLYGRMHPAFIADIKNSGVFKSDDIFLTGLNISKISKYQNESGIYSIKTFNCWETGYLRISGICLPRPTLELTNPPPAYDLAPFSYNNQAYSVLTRCVYGNSTYEKDLSDNYRSINVNYILSNISNKTLVSNGNVSSLQPGVGNGQAIQFNNTLSSGAVFSVRLYNTPNTFPTYRYNSVPYTENEYFWVHKAGNRESTPTQNSFPSVIVTGLQNYIHALSGTAVSGATFRAVGGYIPYAGVEQQIPFYRLSDNSIWNLIDYAPSITGIIQKQLNKNPVVGTYVHSGQSSNTLTITVPQGFYNLQDMAYLSFPDSFISDTGIVVAGSTTLLTTPLSRPGQGIASGYVIAYSQAQVEQISHPFIYLRHNNIVFNTGDYIDISNTSNTISTECNMHPTNDRLSIVSGDNQHLKLTYAGISGNQYSNINLSGYYNIFRNYYDQINVNNLTYFKDGEWRFSLSGINSELYKDYNYKIISIENTGLPIFSGTALTPKKFFVNYPLYIEKPIKIILSQSVIDNGIMNTNGIWTLSFNIEGGRRPVQNYTPEIYINDSICNFSRLLSATDMKDQYDSSTDQLVITITSSNNPANYDWRNIQSFDLKVADETGYDIKTINLNQ